ncbi:pentapeptide repeat-containing protein [Streptomyces aculeolatus]
MLAAVGGVVLAVGLPLLIWRAPYVLDGVDRNEVGNGRGGAALVTGLRTAMVAWVAALGAGIALVYTVRNYRLTRRGQVTDRFIKALERLGSDEMYVRLGGVLALEQIVQDAPEQATHAAQVLAHFVRDRAPTAEIAWPTGPDGTHAPEAEVIDSDMPAADVQAALTALVRPASRAHVDADTPLHFSSLRLTHAYLPGADLTGADLTGTNLTGAVLFDANLVGARLQGANLTGTTLAAADLALADLHRANLASINLTGANLPDAILDESNLTDATLDGANLTRANLLKANLTSANMAKVDLTEARGLTVSQLRAARLSASTHLPDGVAQELETAAE